MKRVQRVTASMLMLVMLAGLQASAAERTVVERFKLDITPESVALDGGGHRAVIKRIPAARQALSVEYLQEGPEGGTAVITATPKYMTAIKEAVAAYMKRPEYVAYITLEKDGKPIDCAAACKVSAVEGRSEVHKVLADTGKLGETLMWSDEVDLAWRDKGDHLDVHVVADYDEGQKAHAHADTITVAKVGENKTIHLGGKTGMQLLLRIERAPG